LATNLKNKRILITAGPTWVKIDKVRVISNIASGQTGFLISRQLQKQGARVTLILGPVGGYCLPEGIKVINYRYFEELSKILRKQVKPGKYHILIHAAAVSDFQPADNFGLKIPSSKKPFNLKLVATAKLIERIKKADPDIFLVGFKLLPEASRSRLLKSAASLIDNSKADLVVANTFRGKAYRAVILDSKRTYAFVWGKQALAKNLAAVLRSTLK
jgi:phosphopantothenoylcysteine decarboxylase/phosphopantothenate--cysteine ligase